MAWKEIYTGDNCWCCKVPSNSIYYNSPEKLTNICKAFSTRGNNGLFGDTNDSRICFSYRNTKEVEELKLTFYPKFHRFSINTYGGNISLDMDYRKKDRVFDCKLNTSLGIAKSEDYFKDNLKWMKPSAVPAEELLPDMSGFVMKVLDDFQDCFLKYYQEYKNGNTEFLLEYTDWFTKLEQKAVSCGLQLAMEETDTYGYEITLSGEGNYNYLTYTTEPCRLKDLNGPLQHLVKFCGIGSGYMKDISAVFEHINTVLDCYSSAGKALEPYLDNLKKGFVQQDD